MDHFITRRKAKEMIDLYRAQMNSILNPDHQGKDILAYSEAFDRKAFDTLLENPETQKLRIYYGMSDDLKIHAIIVRVDENGRDVLMGRMAATETISKSSADGSENVNDDDIKDVVDEGARCPPLCSPEP